MNRTVQRCAIIVGVGVYVVLSICAPWVLGDKNGATKHFIEEDLVELLGVILALTLASASNLHLEFNRIEDAKEKTIFVRTRGTLKRVVFVLIFLFLAAVVLVVTKPLIVASDITSSFFNGFALLIVFFNVLALIDLTQAVFKIKPTHENDE